MRAAAALAAALAAAPPRASGHGHLTYPPSTRQNGSIAKAGDCYAGECRLFSDYVTIPRGPTVNTARLRTMSVNVSGGAYDWTRRHPWRAPGTAPVFGSGCGAAGGGPVPGLWNGGLPPPGVAQGADGLTLPRRAPQAWRRGGAEKVAFALHSNHGGGYSYRLCRAGAGVSETCFQGTPLRFVGDRQWIEYKDLRLVIPADATQPGYERRMEMPRVEIPRVTVTEGTHPPGSEWARNPIPACSLCPAAAFAACGEYAGEPEPRRSACEAACLGVGLDHCPPGRTMFPEPAPGLSGHIREYKGPAAKGGFIFSIVDEVAVPADLDEGDYLLSWRWDAEHSPQIWQNCADIRVVAGPATKL